MQPHDSADLNGLDVELRWIAIPPQVWEYIGLPTQLNSFTAFVGHFGLDEFDEMDEEAPLPDFVPNPEGVSHELPDGVSIQVRLVKGVHGAFQPQWCHAAVYATSVYACICTIAVVPPILSF